MVLEGEKPYVNTLSIVPANPPRGRDWYPWTRRGEGRNGKNIEP